MHYYIPFILLDLLSHVINNSYKALSLYFAQVLIQLPLKKIDFSSVIPWTEFKGRRDKNNNNIVYNIPVIQKFIIFVVAHFR
jgi:hypothetical protein